MATQQHQNDAFGTVVLGWYAPEFMRFVRTKWWYLGAGLLDLALVAYAIWSGSWSMAAVFIVLPLVYALEHRVHPKAVEVIISPYGIKFGPKRMAYSDIKGFWIYHHPPCVDELHIKLNNRWGTDVAIPLMGADPIQIRQYLVTQIQELEGQKPSLADHLVRFFKLA